MTTVAIVQARMNSSRLPGKVLNKLGGTTVLSLVLERCLQVDGVDTVCCAIPEDEASKPLALEAERAGAVVFTGSENDVVARYFGAAAATNADVVLRVTSDCPVIDPQVCAEVLRLRDHEHADFATNNIPPSWPHGLDCEAFTFALLKRVMEQATDPDDREHVSPWMRREKNIKRVNLACNLGDLSEHRWTLDYPEDLEFFEALFQKLPRTATTAQILETVERHPSLMDINRIHHRLPA